MMMGHSRMMMTTRVPQLPTPPLAHAFEHLCHATSTLHAFAAALFQNSQPRAAAVRSRVQHERLKHAAPTSTAGTARMAQPAPALHQPSVSLASLRALKHVKVLLLLELSLPALDA